MNIPLPDPNEPIQAIKKDGKVYINLPSRGEAEQIVHRAYRKLAELPAPSQQTNPISVVISYELFGLSDEDIAIAMALTVAQVTQIKRHEAYVLMRKQIVDNIVNAGKNEVKHLFVEKQRKAADRIIELVDHPKGQVALKASQLVLGGSGVSLEAKAEPNDSMKDGITIVIVENDRNEVPSVNLEPVNG